MKKNYLFTLAALLLGSTIANAQKPLDGYEAPSFTAPGNCGKVISLSTSGALENYTDLKDLTTGKIEQELFVAPGAKVKFSIKITTYWGRFAIFTDANSSKEITRLLQCGVPGPSNPYNDETNGVLVHAEDNPNPTPDGTLPSITIPQDAAEGTVYLFRMIFTTMDDINTYAPSFKEGIYHDIKITVKNNIQRYTINIATPENGTLTIKNGETPIESGAQVPEGTVLSVAAAPSTGYELVSIKNNDEIYASETFVASADANFAAQFKKLASTGDAMLTPGYGEAGDCQLRFSDTVLGSHNTDKNQVESDQRSRNYTFSAWISPMGYNGVLMGHVQNSITWAVEGSYGVGVKDGKLDALQKTNGRSTVEVTYNTPVEEEAAYELRRFDVAIGESPAPVKTYSNLYAVNLGEKYKFASVSVNDTPLENINDPIKVTDQNLTVNATFELATGIEDVTAEATAYYNDKVLYMPQGATAVIYNLLGTAVAEATEMTTNLENLPAGIYLAKVSMGENTTIIRFKK